MAGAPVDVQPDSLPEAFQQQRQLAFDAVPLEPQLSASSGVKPCTYQRWFARPAGFQRPNYWDVPMGTAELQSVPVSYGLSHAAH